MQWTYYIGGTKEMVRHFLRKLWSHQQSDEEALQELFQFIGTEMLFNRAAMNQNTLVLFKEMLEAGRPGTPEGMKQCGFLFRKLVNEFAREAGKTLTKPKETLRFLKEELKGFDTQEAKERRERAVANEILSALGVKDRV